MPVDGEHVPGHGPPDYWLTMKKLIRRIKHALGMAETPEAPKLVINVGALTKEGAEVEFDWNDEFIAQLYSHGFASDSELESVLLFTKWMFIMRIHAEGESELLGDLLSPKDMNISTNL